MELFRTNFNVNDTAVGIAYNQPIRSVMPGVNGDNRFGRDGIILSGSLSTYSFSSKLPNTSPIGMHIAYYIYSTLPPSSQVQKILTLTDGGVPQIILQVTDTGQLQVVVSPSTIIGNSNINLLSPNRWYSIEVKAVIASGTGGSVTVQVNTVPWITLTGQNTKSTTNSYVNGFFLGDSSSFVSSYFTDVVVWDTAGTTNNDFYGDCRVDWIAPSGAAATLSGFTSFTGGPSDPTGTLYQSPTVNSTVMQTLSTPPTLTGTIKSVCPVVTIRKTDNSFTHDCQAMIGTSSSGSLVTATSANLGTTAAWLPYAPSFATNPADVAWTTTDLATLQIGVKIV